MELQEYFEQGLTPVGYQELLGEKLELHATHWRKAEIDPQAVAAIRACGPYRVLVITEPWCGDSLALLPVVLRLFQEVGGSEPRIVRRDEHPELIDRYRTQGGRAIPIVLFLDAEGGERGRWGPRPGPAQEIFESFRQRIASGEVSKEEVHRRIRNFYARDRGWCVVQEIAALLGQPR